MLTIENRIAIFKEDNLNVNNINETAKARHEEALELVNRGEIDGYYILSPNGKRYVYNGESYIATDMVFLFDTFEEVKEEMGLSTEELFDKISALEAANAVLHINNEELTKALARYENYAELIALIESKINASVEPYRAQAEKATQDKEMLDLLKLKVENALKELA